jgi:very-short-patch-repair endonuclease
MSEPSNYRNGLRPARKTGAYKTCTVCSNVFYVQKNRVEKAEFCSKKCKGIASRLPKNACKVCGTVFQPRMGRKDQPCCSRKCGNEYRKIREMQKCEFCGKEFYPSADTQRFCTVSCANEWQSRNKSTHTCKTCGNEFRLSPSKTKDSPYERMYCSIGCYHDHPETKKRMAKMVADQQKMLCSSIEKIGYEILDSIGIEYIRQHLIGDKFCVDAFIPNHNFVVQFDGDYWHGNTDKFPALDARQKKRVQLDKSQDAYMAVCGYKVLRFWEHVINSSPDSVRKSIQDALTQK